MVPRHHPFFYLYFFNCSPMVNSGPIAVFDSGYGGLTVLHDLLNAFPDYDFIYYGDNARAPYGNRSFDVVYQYTLEAVRKLFKMGAPLVILACNTASAKALRSIQQKDLPLMDPDLRVLGVIRPSVEEMGSISHSGFVGVLGTTGTVLSESYPLEIGKLFPHLTVTQEACPMWVSLVENDEVNSEGARYFVKKNLDRLFSKAPKTDTVILGCTHYPLLLPLIKEFVPEYVKIVSQGPIVASRLKDYLKRHPGMDQKLSRGGEVKFYTTEYPERFNQSASLFLGRAVNAIHVETGH
jgi:glutamate racemase